MKEHSHVKVCIWLCGFSLSDRERWFCAVSHSEEQTQSAVPLGWAQWRLNLISAQCNWPSLQLCLCWGFLCHKVWFTWSSVRSLLVYSRCAQFYSKHCCYWENLLKCTIFCPYESTVCCRIAVLVKRFSLHVFKSFLCSLFLPPHRSPVCGPSFFHFTIGAFV